MNASMQKLMLSLRKTSLVLEENLFRVIYEKVIEFGQSLYVCFVDYEKAFDRIDWQKLMECLKLVRLDRRER